MKRSAAFSVLFFIYAVMGAACPAGYTSNNGQTPCTACAAGTYQPNTGQTSCRDTQQGYYSPAGSAQQFPCGPGSYSSSSKSATCTTCPAGAQCTAQQNSSFQRCSPGTYQPNPGATTVCPDCLAGTFNNVQGARSCCDCCAGWYNNNTHETNCQRCSDQPNTGGPVRSNSKNNCRADDGTATSTCQMSGNNCPATVKNGPSPSNGITRRDGGVKCGRGYKRCPVSAGRGTLGGFDCVDVANDLESCGGCVSPDGPSDGRDCSSIVGVDQVQCIRGRCNIRSCGRDFSVSIDGNICVKDGSKRSKRKTSGHEF